MANYPVRMNPQTKIISESATLPEVIRELNKTRMETWIKPNGVGNTTTGSPDVFTVATDEQMRSIISVMGPGYTWKPGENAVSNEMGTAIPFISEYFVPPNISYVPSYRPAGTAPNGAELGYPSDAVGTGILIPLPILGTTASQPLPPLVNVVMSLGPCCVLYSTDSGVTFTPMTFFSSGNIDTASFGASQTFTFDTSYQAWLMHSPVGGFSDYIWPSGSVAGQGWYVQGQVNGFIYFTNKSKKKGVY